MKPLLLLFLIVLPVFTPPLVFSIDSENRVKKSTLSRKNQLSSELAIEEEKKTADVLFKAGFNVKEKEEIVVNLVNRGAEYLENHELADACNTFSSSQSFMSGEVYLFVFDKEGRIIAHGEQLQLMFQNLYNTKDQFGTLYVQNIIKTATVSGNWVTYGWRDAIKRTYIKKISKGGDDFIIGAGYYPHTKSDAVVNMVKAGVSLFNETLKLGYSISEPFSTMNYPLQSIFTYGDLYLFALGFDGTVYAQGDRPGLTGTNALDYQDSNGNYPNKEIISKLKLKDLGEGIWIEYNSKNTLKRVYAEKVIDGKENYYFIACGYYPDASEEAALNLVGKASQYVEGHGKTASVDIFSTKRDNTYRYGDLSITLYDSKGTVIASGSNDELIGKNMFNDKDEDGNLYIQRILQQANAGGGWVPCKLKNAYQSIYVEPVKIGLEKYVLTSGIYAVSKSETMVILVKSGIAALQAAMVPQDAFSVFIQPNGGYIRGDLKLFVFDTNGICFAWGDNHQLIWKNIIDWKDQKGKHFIRTMIEAVTFGPSKVTFQFNGRKAIAHVELVEKNNKKYIIGSSFYL
ncbi:MAG TPA: cache domain-containing protein [Patescibacteria group bacterium]|jgi:signal transduction histidine kinase|nr:cache domain-containing protein [Patescibacteria group bacterium]